MITDNLDERPAFSNPDSLECIEADCWRFLLAAVENRESGWRLPVLATTGVHGPRQRIVVLRGVNAERRQLFAHTDIRSGKVAAIRSSPQVSWLFYDSVQQAQLLLSGTATVQSDQPLTDWLWNQESSASLRGYLAPLPPGTLCGSPTSNLPRNLADRIPERAELAAGRANFSIICCQVEVAEWVLLRRQGNLRAIFTYKAEQLMSADWLAP